MALAFALLSSCASPGGYERLEQRQAKARPRSAAYAADLFYTNSPPEERQVRPQTFYYKQCFLESRGSYPNKSQYTCSDPF